MLLRIHFPAENLLVEGLGVGGGGRDVGVTGSLVGAGGELELVGGLEVGVAGGAVGGGVVLEVEKKGEHCRVKMSATREVSAGSPVARSRALRQCGLQGSERHRGLEGGPG